MKFKKVISGLLTATMLLGLLPSALAAGKPTVTISSGEVTAGDSVTLTVSIEDNPGLAACMVYVYYDTSVFTVDPNADIRTAGKFQSTGMLMGNSIANAKQNGRYDGEARKDGVLGLWYNASGVNTVDDGPMLTVTLHARANATNGTYQVGVDYSENDTCNQESQSVSMATVAGSVVLSGGKDNAGTSKPGTVTPEPEEEEQYTFLDVSGHWAEDYINEAADLGLIQGYAGYYRPNDTMTRAECVTILWRASGSPKPAKAASFTDMDPKQTWYWDAAAWAEETGVVNGIGNGKFDPYGTVTREMLATILHRMAGSPLGMEVMLASAYDTTYSDSGTIGNWAKSSLYWSIYNVIYCGVDSVTAGSALYPKESASRAQIAVMIVRYLERD